MSDSDLVMVSATVLALASSGLLLRRYRVAVVRLMSLSAPPSGTSSDPLIGLANGLPDGPLNRPPDDSSAESRSGSVAEAASLGSSGRSPPRVQDRPGRTPPGVRLGVDLARRRRQQIGIAFGAGGFIGLAYAWLFLVWNGVEGTAGVFLFLAAVFAWPAVPAVWIASDGDRRWTAGAAAVLVVAPLPLAMAAGLGVLDGLMFWARVNALATVVVAVLVTRVFRAVGVCVLGLWLAGLLGAYAAVDSPGLAAVLETVSVIAPGADSVFWASIVTGTVLVGGCGWLVFRALARWYAARGFSDHMLLLGSLCLVFCLAYVTALGLGQPVLLLIALGLFSLLFLGVRGAYRLLPTVTAPHRLLVLRVFGDPGAARLLNITGDRWRHLGPVCLIGGPDLASATIGPDTVLTFLGHGLRRLFLATRSELADRLALPDAPPDPDGRYRVEEWFCFEPTWRPAVAALLERSDVVLLDLRGFTAQRQGIRHELGLLARTGALARCVAITDGSTDLALLDTVIAGTDGPGPRMLRMDSADPDTILRALTRS